MRRRRANPFATAVVIGSLVLAATLAGCSGSEPTEAEARRERVTERLEDSFSAAQTRCILDRVDDTVVRALDRQADLDPGSEAQAAYSEAVTACVADPDAPPPETTTTTAAPGSTTTSPG